MAFPSLSIGDLTAKMPIVQGGMGVGISLSGLASAVANQGGIGVIAGAMIGMKEPDVAKNPIEANLRALRQELTKAREKTQGIIGVNIMVALTTFSQMVRTCDQEKTPYCIAQALISAMKGNLERGFAFCGANVARVNSIVSVKELMESLQQEFDQTISKGKQTLQGLLK